MKLSRKRVIAGILALIVLVLTARAVIPSVRFLVGVVVFTRKWVRHAERGRDHLFFETDYQELLAACRDLSKRAAAGELPSGSYNVCFGKRDPETLSFPQVILDLEPSRVFTDLWGGGEVCIELMPGPEWRGVIACPEGSEKQGNVKLIEGLWYCDPGYQHTRPKYVTRINDMIEKGRQLRASRAAPPP